MSKQFTLRLGNPDGELTYVQLDNNQSILLESASLTYSSASISGNTLKLFSLSSTGSITPITHSYEIVSSSYAVTASYAMSSSVEITKEVSSSNADTASYFAEGIITASAVNNIITFTKDNSSTFDLTINTGSLKAGLLSSSAQIAEDISGSLSNVAISALNAGIVSASAQIRDRLVSAGAFSSASNASIRNTLGTNQFILSGSKPNANTLRLHPAAGTNLDYEVGGASDDRVDGLLLESGSVKSRLNTLEAITGSILDATSSYALKADISGSGNVRFEALNSATSSYALKTDISGSGDVRFEALNAATSSYALKTDISGSGNVRFEALNSITGSLIKNAALSGSTTNTIRFTKQDDSTIDLTIATSSISIDGLLSSSAQIAEDISGSGNVRFEALNAATSSYALKADVSGSGNVRFEALNAATSSYATKLDMNLVSGSGIINAALSGSTTNTIRFTQQDQSTIDLTIVTSSVSIDGLLSSSAQIAGDISGSGNVRFEALNAATSSYLLNTTDTLTGNLTVTGDITANKITTNIVTSSIAFTSGSNKFGDNQVDKHMFTGSVQISQSLDITGSLTLNGVAITTGSNTVLNIIEGGGINVSNSSGIFTVSAEAASATNAGITEYASTTEMTEGTSTTRAVTPANYLSRSTDLDVLNISGILTATSSYYNSSSISEDTLLLITSTTTHSLSGDFTDTNTFRTVKVDTTNDGTANETIGATEQLQLVGGSNVTLAESAGKVTITAAGTTATNLSKTVSGDGFSINSSTGDNIALSLADTSNWGLMSDEMFDKLDGIEASADVTDTTNVKANMPDGVPSGSASQARSQIGAGTGDGTVTEVTVGTGLDVADGTTTPEITLDLSELTDMTENVVGSQDELIILDNGAEKRKLISEITLSDFNNDSNWNNYSHPNHTGDVTSSGDGATTIANDKVTYAKMQNIPTANILGRVTAGTGNVEDLTATQVRTLLNVADGATNVTNNNQITNGAGYTTAAGTVDTSGTPAAQQIAIFTDANTISGSTNLQMHVNGSYPEFGGLQVGSGGTANLYLGNAITPSSADKGARFHSNNNDFYFDFQGDATQHFYFRDYDGSGGIFNRFTFDFINSDFATNTATFSGNVTANNFITTSDRKLKKDIEPIKEGLETLKRFVSYEYELNNKKDAGFIAQEVEESLPYAVHTKKDGYLALDTKPIIAHMHKAILEIDKRLSAIEEKLK